MGRFVIRDFAVDNLVLGVTGTITAFAVSLSLPRAANWVRVVFLTLSCQSMNSSSLSPYTWSYSIPIYEGLSEGCSIRGVKVGGRADFFFGENW